MRLTKLEPKDFRYLEDDDECWHLGEYTSHGGFKASETNRQILNLKKLPTVPAAELKWKRRAVEYWGNLIANSNVDWEHALRDITFVPMPCSKPSGHELYDDRMLRVLMVVLMKKDGLDVRPILTQTEPREPQHLSARSTPDEIAEKLGIDHSKLSTPMKSIVVVVDDVITRGASFAAAKRLLSPLEGVEAVYGLFLAKTIHPPVEWEFDEIPDF